MDNIQIKIEKPNSPINNNKMNNKYINKNIQCYLSELRTDYITKKDIQKLYNNKFKPNNFNNFYKELTDQKIKVTNKSLTNYIEPFNNEDDLIEHIENLKDTEITQDTRFKRVCLSPLRYAGGKSKAVGLILKELQYILKPGTTIVSLFFGGGSFELVLSQELGFNVIGYDTFDMLTNFWDILINHKNDFITELEKLHKVMYHTELPDQAPTQAVTQAATQDFIKNKKLFTRNRHILLEYWNTIKPVDLDYKTKKVLKLTDEEKSLLKDKPILQAVYYYYNMTLSYGPMFLGWPSSNEIKKDKLGRRIKKLKNLNLNNLQVKQSEFEKLIKIDNDGLLFLGKHKDDFLFLDPPYYLGKDSKMFKGMYPNCNFAIHHNEFKHELLRNLLKNHKGGFLMTYNNCPTIREWYKEYELVFPEWQYTYGQGETRIGKNRKNNGIDHNIKESHEIFIICPPKD